MLVGPTSPRHRVHRERRLPSERRTPRREAALLPGGRQRGGGLQGRLPAGPVAGPEGPDRVRQDALRRGDGPRPRPAADHRRLPRRSDHRRPGRPVPAAGRRDGVGRRSADPRGARGRDLLPRRGGRGAPGHHRGAAPARRLPAAAAHRAARRDAGRGARIRPGGVVQPRLSERAQGPQGFDPAAHGRHRIRFPRSPKSKRGSSRTRPASTHAIAAELVRFGQAIRRLETGGLREVASTRVLIAAGRLVAEGLSMPEAARAAIAGPLTDESAVGRGLDEMIDVYLRRSMAAR